MRFEVLLNENGESKPFHPSLILCIYYKHVQHVNFMQGKSSTRKLMRLAFETNLFRWNVKECVLSSWTFDSERDTFILSCESLHSASTGLHPNLVPTTLNLLWLSAFVFFALIWRCHWTRRRVVVGIDSHFIIEIIFVVVTLSTVAFSDLFLCLLQLLPCVAQRFGKMIVNRHWNSSGGFGTAIDHIDTRRRCISCGRCSQRRGFVAWTARRWCPRLWWLDGRSRRVRMRRYPFSGRCRNSARMLGGRLQLLAEQIHVVGAQRTSEMFVDNWIHHGNGFGGYKCK